VTSSLPRARTVSPARGPQLGHKRAPARALAPGWAEIPPGPASWISLFLFLFPFLFPIFIYIYLYADILCTKNSPNK
jgi:hypothetical protein